MPVVSVPGSTTNLGHGFDCLGIALDLANTITVEPGGDRIRAGTGSDPALEAMAAAVRSACAERWRVQLPYFTIAVAGAVPVARGMGSSATILVGVAAACAALAGRAHDPIELATIAAAIEGHPDNVAAAACGGLTIADGSGGQLRIERLEVPDRLRAVVAIPPWEVKTSEARRILPDALSRADAVRAWSRTALIVARLAKGDLDGLRGLFDEAWHERWRSLLNPGVPEVKAAAAQAGALGTIISGSGSTVLAFATTATAPAVEAAIRVVYHTRGVVGATVLTTGFSNAGAQLIG
ncbi:homoserine kinase [Planctomycetota bacterium]|nr:homoserine kinase [Planctomycetota bacterium]